MTEEYEEPIAGFELTFHKKFPYLIEIKCPDCGKKGIFSLKLEQELYDDVEIVEILKGH